MSFSLSALIKKVRWYRRSGDTLVKEHPETSGDMVQLTAQNGVTNGNVQAELEAVRTWMNAYVSGTCGTAAATVAKTLTINNFVLQTGSMVCVTFTQTNTAASPTLNISSTGAKSIYFLGAPIESGWLVANNPYLLRYNGAQYEVVATDITIYQTQLAAALTNITRLQGRVATLETRMAELISWCAAQGYEESLASS